MNIIITTISLAMAGALEPAPSPVEQPEQADVNDTIVVTARRGPETLSGAVVATQVIDAKQIEASGAVVLGQLLEMVPGLQIMNSVRGTGLSLRGHDPSHLLILVDGRRVIGRISGTLDLRRFAVDEIQRIEIVRGPTSAIYGADALGGVLNIITKGAPKSGWRLNMRGQAGGYVTPSSPDAFHLAPTPTGVGDGLAQLDGHVQLSGREGPVSGHIGVSAQGLDGWDRTPNTPNTTGDALRMFSPSGGITLDAGRAKIGVDFNGSLQDGRGIDATPSGAVIERAHRLMTLSSGVRLDIEPSWRGNVHIEVDGNLYHDALREDQRGADLLDSYAVTDQKLAHALLQLDGWVDRSQRHHLQGGVEGFLEQIQAQRIQGGQANRQRGALYLQHLWRALDDPGISVLTGVRIDIDSRFGVFPAPRLALRFDPHPALRIRLAGGLGFRAPDFKQLYLDFSNPGVGYRVMGRTDLKPERSVGATLDVDLMAHKMVKLTLSAWHDELYDLIAVDLVQDGGADQATVYAYVNIGRGRIDGLTPTLSLGPIGPVHAQLSYTYIHAWDIDNARLLPGRASHQGVVRLLGDHKQHGLSWSIGASLLGPRPYYGNTAGISLDEDLVSSTPFTPLLDARFAWSTPRGAVSLFAGVDNVLDAGRTALAPTRPRRIYGGISLKLKSKEKS